jgi:hypothetical protein
MAPLDWCSVGVPLSDHPMPHPSHIHGASRFLIQPRVARMPEQIQ